MNKYTLASIAIIIFALVGGAIASAATINSMSVANTLDLGWPSGTVIKVYDAEADTLCYVYTGPSKGGISCLTSPQQASTTATTSKVK